MTELSELAEKAERVSRLYARRCDIRRDDDWFALKLQEEAGELVAEYLRGTGRGRRRPETAAVAAGKLADEAADLFAQLLLFCLHNGVDLEAALERKWFVHLDAADAGEMADPMTLAIRPAVAGDEALIVNFIMELAVYEKLAHEARATPEDIARDLFGPVPKVFCDIAEWGGEAVGFALWFYTYSTFEGRHGIWLEDLFVDPKLRGKGIGKGLLKGLAERCVREHLGRLEWWVLDWNAPSIAFYKAQGAVMQGDWTRCRMDGAALARLGAP